MRGRERVVVAVTTGGITFACVWLLFGYFALTHGRKASSAIFSPELRARVPWF